MTSSRRIGWQSCYSPDRSPFSASVVWHWLEDAGSEGQGDTLRARCRSRDRAVSPPYSSCRGTTGCHGPHRRSATLSRSSRTGPMTSPCGPSCSPTRQGGSLNVMGLGPGRRDRAAHHRRRRTSSQAPGQLWRANSGFPRGFAAGSRAHHYHCTVRNSCSDPHRHKGPERRRRRDAGLRSRRRGCTASGESARSRAPLSSRFPQRDLCDPSPQYTRNDGPRPAQKENLRLARR